MTVAVVVAGQGSPGVTLADIQRVVCSHLASPRRVRALIEELERTAGISRVQARGDTRRRLIIMGGWLPGALDVWAGAYVRVVGQWFPRRAQRFPDGVRACATALIAGWANLHARYGFLLTEGCALVSMIMNRLGGHPMLLELIGSAVPAADGSALARLSRKRLARSVGLSRAQITKLLAACEQRGWLRRDAGAGSFVQVFAVAYGELRRWIAREIAFVLTVMAGPRAS